METSIRKYYGQLEFVAMDTVPVNAAQFKTFLSSVSFDVPPVDVFDVGGHTIAVAWESLPTPADFAAADQAVATFVATAPTDEPFQFEALGVASNPNTALVDVIHETTPPLDAGTYQVTWNALVGMLATVANAGVRAVLTVTRTQGSNVVNRTWEHNWNLQQPQLFGSATTFECAAGATIAVRLQLARIGVAATAQMASARVTVDKVG